MTQQTKSMRRVKPLADGTYREVIVHQTLNIAKNGAQKEVARRVEEGDLFRVAADNEKPDERLVEEVYFQVVNLIRLSTAKVETNASKRKSRNNNAPSAAPPAPEGAETDTPIAEESNPDSETTDEGVTDDSTEDASAESDQEEAVAVNKKPKAKRKVAKKAKAKTKSVKPKKTAEKKPKVAKVREPKAPKAPKEDGDLPKSGQSGPQISNMKFEKLNSNEQKVLRMMAASDAKTLRIVEISGATFERKEGPEKANSWVRNALRRLVRAGFVGKAERGTYKVTAAGRKVLA